MSSLKSFTHRKARPLPVIILADISGSMSVNGKIEALNNAMASMMATFAEESDGPANIEVSVISFASQASVHMPLTPASEASWSPMPAGGRTSMGAAFKLALNMLDDRQKIPSRAYRPTLVLVTDGIPTDDWEEPLLALDSGRASKAVRYAMGIGADANRIVLESFTKNPELVFEASDARQIRGFFQFVTMSTTSRSQSANPNNIPTSMDIFALGEF